MRKPYQYLLGKVSTDVLSNPKKIKMYQYLLGKVSTEEKNYN